MDTGLEILAVLHLAWKKYASLTSDISSDSSF